MIKDKHIATLNNLKVHFFKSILITIDIDIFLVKDFIKKNDLQGVTKIIEQKMFYDYAINRQDYGRHQELIKETLSIEYEKINLRDDSKKIATIFLDEIRFNKEREQLLYMGKKGLMSLCFIVNPYIETYESNWRIIQEFTDKNFIIKDLIEDKGDFYFLFQRIDIYDSASESNIIESPLIKAEYFVLYIFKKAKRASIALDEFINLFEYNTQKEYNEIKYYFFEILKESLFHKHIIKYTK